MTEDTIPKAIENNQMQVKKLSDTGGVQLDVARAAGLSAAQSLMNRPRGNSSNHGALRRTPFKKDRPDFRRAQSSKTIRQLAVSKRTEALQRSSSSRAVGRGCPLRSSSSSSRRSAPLRTSSGTLLLPVPESSEGQAILSEASLVDQVPAGSIAPVTQRRNYRSSDASVASELTGDSSVFDSSIHTVDSIRLRMNQMQREQDTPARPSVSRMDSAQSFASFDTVDSIRLRMRQLHDVLDEACDYSLFSESFGEDSFAVGEDYTVQTSETAFTSEFSGDDSLSGTILVKEI